MMDTSAAFTNPGFLRDDQWTSDDNLYTCTGLFKSSKDITKLLVEKEAEFNKNFSDTNYLKIFFDFSAF